MRAQEGEGTNWRAEAASAPSLRFDPGLVGGERPEDEEAIVLVIKGLGGEGRGLVLDAFPNGA